MSFFSKIQSGLQKTVKAMQYTLSDTFRFTEIDEDFYADLEDALILADLGVATVEKVISALKKNVAEQYLTDPQEVREALERVLVDMLDVGSTGLNLSVAPSVILVIGVNGVGKTTTIGKLASVLHGDGKNVLLCAADTFRAAAADQLEIWAERANVPLVRQAEGADPASVVYDAILSSKARSSDVILCDTAGRLHNKQNLMNELNKIARIIDRELPNASKEVLLVLDATTGQNGLAQAVQFCKMAGVTGVVLTKLDGTAKGGVVVSVADTLHVPVKYVGVGEQVGDLIPFNAKEFVHALMEGTK